LRVLSASFLLVELMQGDAAVELEAGRAGEIFFAAVELLERLS